MSHTVNQSLHELLKNAHISYRVVSHPPTTTSEESAIARGESLHVGGKALVIKAGDEFRLFVLSAALRIDSSAIKRHVSVNKIRFASADELLELTGLVPGAVPPFGRPMLPLDLYVDASIQQNSVIAFNAGSLTESFILEIDDYLRIAKPSVFAFSKAE